MSRTLPDVRELFLRADERLNVYRVAFPWWPQLPDGCPRVRQPTIPHGFPTDLASIPRVLWTLVGSPARPRFWKAATLHDFYYRTQTVDRAVADAVFERMLIESGVGPRRAALFHRAVRIFGGARWGRAVKAGK